MVTKTTQAEVDLEVDGAGVTRAINLITTQLNQISQLVGGIADKARGSALGVDKQLNGTVKAMQKALGQISAMQKLIDQQNQAPVRQLNQNRALAQATTQASNYAKTLRNAESAAEALEGRLNQVQKKIAGVGASGGLASRRDLSTQMGLKSAVTDLKALDAELTRIEAKARRSGGNFRAQQADITTARGALTEALLNPRRSNFTKEMTGLADAQARFADAVVASRRAQAELIRTARRAEQAIPRQTDTAWKEQERRQNQEQRRLAEIDKAHQEQAKRRQIEEEAAYRQRDAQTKQQSEAERQRGEAALVEQKARADAEAQAQRAAVSRANQERLNERMRVRTTKELVAAEVAAARQSGTLDAQRIRATGLIAAARERLRNATIEEQRKLFDILAIEKERLRIVQQQEREIARNQARQDRDARSGNERSPVQNILSPRYAAAAFARTSVYGFAAGGAYGVFNAVRDGLRFTVEFEDALKTLQAIAGATDQQLNQLTDTIRNVASTSRYSTLEITKSATILAQAGLSTTDVGVALKAVSDLATASGSTAAESVDLITAAIGSFQLQASEAARVSDVLVAALNRSKLTVTQVAQAIQYVGATAYENNITLEQLVSTAGALSNAGIRSGSTIGTGLRQFLVDLKTPTDKLLAQLKSLNLTLADIDVKTLGLPEVLNRLSAAGFGAAQAYGSLETRAAASYLVLRNNLDVMADLQLAVAQQGAAAEATARAVDSLSAQWQIFKNNLNDIVNTALAPMRDMLKEILTLLNNSKSFLSDLGDTGMGKAIMFLAGIVASTLDPLARFRTLLDGLGASARDGSDGMEDLATASINASEAVDASKKTIDAVDNSLARLLLQQESLRDNQVLVQAETVTLSSRFAGLATQLAATQGGYDGLITAMRRYRAEQLRLLEGQLLTQETTSQNEAAGLRGQAINQIRGISARDRAGLSPMEQQRLRTLLSSPRQNAGQIADFATSYEKQFPELAQQLRSIVATVGNLVVTEGNARRAQLLREEAGVRRMSGGQTFQARLEEANALVARATSAAAPMDLAGRQKEFVQSKAFVDSQIKALNEVINNPNADAPTLRVAKDFLSEFESLKNQIVGQTSSTLKEDKEAERAAKAAEREARRQRSGEQFAERQGLKTADLNLKDALARGKTPQSMVDFERNRVVVEAALEEWIAQRYDLMRSEILAKSLSGETRSNFERDVKGEIEAKVAEVGRTINDGLKALLDAQIKAIDRAYEAELAGPRAAVARAEGTAAGLGRPSLQGLVPDYVRELAERRAAQAQENLDRQTLPADEARLAETRALLAEQEAQLQRQLASGDTLGAEATVVRLEELNNRAVELARNIDNLRANLSAGNVIPQSFNESLRKAAENYRAANDTGLSFGQMLRNNLGGTLSEVHAGFTGFFADIFSGTTTALGAFGNFTAGMIRYFKQLAAQMVATKVFNLLVGLATSARGGGDSSGITVTGRGNATIPGLYGGGAAARLPGYDGGGLVTNGFPNRDSVVARLRKKEYVLQPGAVDSLGVDFLDQLNSQGARALKGLQSTPVIAAGGRQETNVFVVAPDQQPTMGPNDVLVTIANDILADGSTKKLIRHVAQGG